MTLGLNKVQSGSLAIMLREEQVGLNPHSLSAQLHAGLQECRKSRSQPSRQPQGKVTGQEDMQLAVIGQMGAGATRALPSNDL